MESPSREKIEADHAKDSVEIEEMTALQFIIDSTITSAGITIEAAVVIALKAIVGDIHLIDGVEVYQSRRLGNIFSGVKKIMQFSNNNWIHRSRSNRRRSSSQKNHRDLKQVPSAKQSNSVELKSPTKPASQRKKDEPDDIELSELERRVQEAKKVLEVMVKEKMKEKRRSSSSGDDRKRGKKRSNKPRRDSSSD